MTRNKAAKYGQVRLEYLPLSSLKAAKHNPKRHQIDTVLASMRRFGYVAPMILNERTRRLVVGHGRLESLKRAKAEGKEPPERIFVESGEWLVPVVRGVAFEDDREAEAYLLADNQTTSVFPVRLPPLRERPEDIPLLVRHFAQQFGRRNNKAIETIPSETMNALVGYHWPGNVRELQNVIERSVILSTGPVLKVPLSELRNHGVPDNPSRLLKKTLNFESSFLL